jgi:hypothetical protein
LAFFLRRHAPQPVPLLETLDLACGFLGMGLEGSGDVSSV